MVGVANLSNEEQNFVSNDQSERSSATIQKEIMYKYHPLKPYEAS